MRKSHTECGWKNWKRVSGVLCNRRMNVKINGKVYRTVVRPALMYGAETRALKKAGQDQNLKNKRDNESGGNHKESTGKKVEVVWACGAKRGTLRRKEGDGNESTGAKEQRKT